MLLMFSSVKKERSNNGIFQVKYTTSAFFSIHCACQ
jgi:hypothetical protein